MSRSVRKPYLMPALGVASQRCDRVRANRAYRRLATVMLSTSDIEEITLPDSRETGLGDRATWSGDGKPKRFAFPHVQMNNLIMKGDTDGMADLKRFWEQAARK